MSKLETDPIELAGDWDGMVPTAVVRVADAMRQACMQGVAFSSDAQPTKLRLELHKAGPPAIWLHRQPRDTAWIILNLGPRDWSKLAYQFGHELGHVVANSWREDAKPAAPCQWLEEAMVEAFSIRGLARLADEWSRRPPFPDDTAFGAALAVYRQNIVEAYGKLAAAQGHSEDLGAWFRSQRTEIESQAFLGDFAKAAALTILSEYETEPDSLAGLSALNRWPERASLPLSSYVDKWEAACHALRLSPALPVRLRDILQLS